jgi:hypothetical protein
MNKTTLFTTLHTKKFKQNITLQINQHKKRSTKKEQEKQV